MADAAKVAREKARKDAQGKMKAQLLAAREEEERRMREAEEEMKLANAERIAREAAEKEAAATAAAAAEAERKRKAEELREMQLEAEAAALAAAAAEKMERERKQAEARALADAQAEKVAREIAEARALMQKDAEAEKLGVRRDARKGSVWGMTSAEKEQALNEVSREVEMKKSVISAFQRSTSVKQGAGLSTISTKAGASGSIANKWMRAAAKAMEAPERVVRVVKKMNRKFPPTSVEEVKKVQDAFSKFIKKGSVKGAAANLTSLKKTDLYSAISSAGLPTISRRHVEELCAQYAVEREGVVSFSEFMIILEKAEGIVVKEFDAEQKRLVEEDKIAIAKEEEAKREKDAKEKLEKEAKSIKAGKSLKGKKAKAALATAQEAVASNPKPTQAAAQLESKSAGKFGMLDHLLEDNAKGIDTKFNPKENIALGRMHEASKIGDVEELKKLIEEGESPDVKFGEGSSTALHWAAWGGHNGCVKLLLESGAICDMKNTHGYSPLHWAAYMGHIDTVKSLVNDGGADLEIGDANGATPLHWAASGGQAAVVKKLLALNANPDALDNKDASPLHWAAGEEESTPGILEVLQLLVKGGTDMDRKQRVVGSIPMCTAFELAKEKNLPLAIKTLEKLKGIWTPKSSAEKKAETDKRQAAAHERIGKARAVLEKRIQANKAAIAAKKVEARNLQRKQSKLSDEAKERQRTEAAAIARQEIIERRLQEVEATKNNDEARAVIDSDAYRQFEAQYVEQNEQVMDSIGWSDDNLDAQAKEPVSAFAGTEYRDREDAESSAQVARAGAEALISEVKAEMDNVSTVSTSSIMTNGTNGEFGNASEGDE